MTEKLSTISMGVEHFGQRNNLVMLEGHEAAVGDGHAMGVTGEIAEHMVRTTEGWAADNRLYQATTTDDLDRSQDQ